MTRTTVSWADIKPQPRQIFLFYHQPELRPPVYDEMVGDMSNIIHKVVAPYVSKYRVELHFEELVAECWLKTTKMNSDGLIDRCRTRSEYFAQYKTAIANHVCSLIQRYVYTEKRTGVKPPPKESRTTEFATRTLPVEVRIDDPDSNAQIAEIESGDESPKYRELMEEVTHRLSYIEKGVMQQLISPNEESLFLAQLDAEIGRQPGEPIRVRIRQEHLARGMGMTPEEFGHTHESIFHQVHESIKRKCTFMKNQQLEEHDARRTAAMATLLQFFGLQIPRSIDDVTRRRALMIAARHQYDKIKNLKENDGIREAMRICDIPIPEVRNDRFVCFGVMYQKHHRTCENCGVKEACALKAANFGLGEITISHKLLGARHARIPVVRPSRMHASAMDEREEEIMAFLDENFKQTSSQNETVTAYRHADGTEAIMIIENVSPLRLRFINPSDQLRPSLKPESTDKGGRRAWLLPESLSTDDSINLIRAHAEITFNKS